MKHSLGLVLTLLLLVVVLLACGKKTPLDDAHKDFAGKWVAADGTFVQFFLDGTGNLKSGSTEVTGGAVTFGQGTVTIKLFGIGKDMQITQPPREVDGKWALVLDGIEYLKE